MIQPRLNRSGRSLFPSEKGKENEPIFRLDEAIQTAAFDQHPYRYEVIGDMQDLWKITRADLYEHYRTYYTPNNALIALAGDFETEKILARLAELYGDIPAGPEIR
jgi:zinc protease